MTSLVRPDQAPGSSENDNELNLDEQVASKSVTIISTDRDKSAATEPRRAEPGRTGASAGTRPKPGQPRKPDRRVIQAGVSQAGRTLTFQVERAGGMGRCSHSKHSQV